MKIAILKESAEHERRVAATPETVKKLIGLGAEVAVEAGAGSGANMSDQSYRDAGATVDDRGSVLAGSAVVFSVQAPPAASLSAAPGTAVVAAFNPFADRANVDAYATARLDAYALEFMPRITRAQSMDILSSQSNLAGYKAVIDCAALYGRAFPMMMTAAGTIAPAKVFIMGAGVAGLQAIATAKRMGSVVTATDVRLAAKEQVESLGGKFIMVDDDEVREAETVGGYAKEMSDAYKAKQAALIAEHVPKQDIVITTALIPGRPAPRLVTADMVSKMKPGSVLFDLAVEQGGNIEGSKPGEIVEVNGVRIVGYRNVPSRLAADASSLFARNLFNFLSAFWDKEGKTVKFDDEDEIIKGIRLTRGGQVVHPRLTGEGA